MAPNPKILRSQLHMLRPLLASCSLKTLRKGQDKVGALMEAKFRQQVLVKEHPFEAFTGAWVLPRDERRQGVILYLHGGGYTCGGLEYATGCGALLASLTGTRVFCAAYRLAPEHRFPAALDDAEEAYRYLLQKGYDPSHITLCGESAGGGLCYSLCLRLKEKTLPLPGSIIAISPWTDLTASGPSYGENRDIDPSMTIESLRFYAKCYIDDPADPMVSPIFADLHGLPPSLIFVGGDEIMRSDAELLHKTLLDAGCSSQLTVRPDRWHAYLLYGMDEDSDDISAINRFLNQHLSREHKLRWLRLDNAAKIYPAARRRTWSNVYRMSVTLTEPVDTEVLQSALDVTVRRFPSVGARLRRGVFWYYLQQLEKAPRIRQENSYPLTRMSRKEIRQCAFRVIAHKNRIAVELFHSLTDGTGALIFLKSLTAEYLQQKHGIHIDAEKGVLGRLEEPSQEELEDSFLKYGGTVSASRRANDAWQPVGTPEADGFLHLTCLELPTRAVLDKAHSYGVSVTAFFGAVMMMALQNLQQEQVPDQLRRKSVKVLLPVNLRRLFPSKTLRNFAMYTIPEIQPRLGYYDFGEICQIVKHKMGLDITPKHMSTMIATNVADEQKLLLRLVPLFLKNIVMKAVFDSIGERKSCLSLSNLGQVEIPEQMAPFVERFDFILGVQASAPYNCGVLSYGDTTYINFIRNIREPVLERHFHQVLQNLDIPVTVRSNRGGSV